MLLRQQHRKPVTILALILGILTIFHVVKLSRSAESSDEQTQLAQDLAISKPSSDLDELSPGNIPPVSEQKGFEGSEDPSEGDVNEVNEETSVTDSKPAEPDYREIFSVSTPDRKFIPIFLSGKRGYNTNIIPHPTKAEFWIIVVQQPEPLTRMEPSEQLVCTAGFLNGALVCTEQPTTVPIYTSLSEHCKVDLNFLNLVWGPRDARVFYGPDVPYIIYGAQSQYICFGLWLQDVRQLLEEFSTSRHTQAQLFQSAVELKRPSEYNMIEKNYFMFWDSAGMAYVHYNLWPKRAFAQLNYDGSGITDLAPLTEAKDQVCMAKFMPELVPEFESIHQATNSLSITLCRRDDPKCTPTDDNTFIMHVFHHKTYYSFHGVYEPHVILFKRTAPFELHAISQRPLWIHGRGNLTLETGAARYTEDPSLLPEGHTEMFYVTSISWKSHDQKYHGYMDDVMFLSFGIEDARPGAIDVIAGDMLQDLAYC